MIFRAVARHLQLQRSAGRADEIAKTVHVGTVRADAAGIDGKAEAFGQVKVYPRVVQFGQAETSSGRDAIHTRGIDRPGRPVTLPGAACQFVKLFPIAFVPTGCHSETRRTTTLMQSAGGRFSRAANELFLILVQNQTLRERRHSLPILQAEGRAGKTWLGVSNP
jgi:hypothetical protein